MINTPQHNSLWVCWRSPEIEPPKNALVLSFSSPSEENLIAEKCGRHYLRGSEVSQKVRDKAREYYVQLVARIGATPCYKGKTFRETLKLSDNELSLWWYHVTSFKDNHSDPTFDRIIAIMTITYVLKKYAIKNVVMVGAAQEIFDVVGTNFYVSHNEKCQKQHTLHKIVCGIGARFRYVFKSIQQILAVKKYTKLPHIRLSVGFFGFWDWSVKFCKKTRMLRDLYYKGLPEELKKRDINDCAWLLWFDPDSEPGSKGRSLKSVLKPIGSRQDVILLQNFLRLSEVIKYILDFRALWRYLLVKRSKDFRNIFLDEGLDYFYLFKDELLYGFINSSISHHRLVAITVERAIRRYNPNVTLSFLEFFPFAKAIYEGISRSRTGSVSCCVQHGSRSSESTFFAFDSLIEYKGAGDGCSIPKPDYCFAMGSLGYKLFKENGFPEDNIILTGSPRFDHVGVEYKYRDKQQKRNITLLFAASGFINIEAQALEAVLLAIKDLEFVDVILREHFFYRLQDSLLIKNLVNLAEISNETLEVDLDKADIVLYTTTTVAEEAFLKGKPVWQWVTPYSNMQAFRDIPVIQRFFSPQQLMNALVAFHKQPEKFYPNSIDMQRVEKECFFKCDGKAAYRIAEEIKKKFL